MVLDPHNKTLQYVLTITASIKEKLGMINLIYQQIRFVNRNMQFSWHSFSNLDFIILDAWCCLIFKHWAQNILNHYIDAINLLFWLIEVFPWSWKRRLNLNNTIRKFETAISVSIVWSNEETWLLAHYSSSSSKGVSFLFISEINILDITPRHCTKSENIWLRLRK